MSGSEGQKKKLSNNPNRKQLELERGMAVKAASSAATRGAKSGSLVRLNRKKKLIVRQQVASTVDAKRSSAQQKTQTVSMQQAQNLVDQLKLVSQKRQILLKQNQQMAKQNAEQIAKHHKLQGNYKILYRRSQMLHSLYKNELLKKTSATQINPHHQATQTDNDASLSQSATFQADDLDMSAISSTSESFLTGSEEEYEESREEHDAFDRSSSLHGSSVDAKNSSSSEDSQHSSFLYSSRVNGSSETELEEEEQDKDNVITQLESENSKLKRNVHECQYDLNAMEEQLEQAQSTIKYLKETFSKHLLELKSQIQS
jgi:hypothetical protein